MMDTCQPAMNCQAFGRFRGPFRHPPTLDGHPKMPVQGLVAEALACSRDTPLPSSSNGTSSSGSTRRSMPFHLRCPAAAVLRNRHGIDHRLKAGITLWRERRWREQRVAGPTPRRPVLPHERQMNAGFGLRSGAQRQIHRQVRSVHESCFPIVTGRCRSRPPPAPALSDPVASLSRMPPGFSLLPPVTPAGVQLERILTLV